MNGTPPEAPFTPQAWCRRILTSLNQQKVEGREAGYLEMLLTYFIELDPSLEAFDGLLQRYCDDSREGIAEGASLLQRSWLRGRPAPAAPVSLPPLQEALRTLGGMLDESEAPGAYIHIEADRLLFQPFGGEAVKLGARELLLEVGARTALRGQVERTDPTQPDRFEISLRAVGAQLDRCPAQSYDVAALPHTIVVEGSADFHAVYTREDLAALISENLLTLDSPTETPTPATSADADA